MGCKYLCFNIRINRGRHKCQIVQHKIRRSQTVPHISIKHNNKPQPLFENWIIVWTRNDFKSETARKTTNWRKKHITFIRHT